MNFCFFLRRLLLLFLRKFFSSELTSSSVFSPLSYLFFHEYMKSHIASRNSMDSAQMVEAADGTLVPVADAGNLYSDTDMKFAM